MPVLFEKLQDAAKVIAPRKLFVSEEMVERKLGLRVEIEGKGSYAAVLTAAARKPDKPVDGRRQNVPVVVVGVLADQVYSSRSARHDLWLRAENLFEAQFDHGRRLRWGDA